MTRAASPRLILPRRSLLGAAASLVALGPASTLWAAGEGGEAGEGAVLEGMSPELEFLTILGLFEAQHRIIAALWAEGAKDTAAEHLAESHHAFYEDLAPGMAALSLPGFQAETEAFAAAVNSGGDVEATLAPVLSAIATARQATGSKDQMKAAEALLRVAAGDLEAGVEAGQVTLAQEYRDAWGFATVAGLWLDALAEGPEAEAAGATKAAMAEALAQFGGITATSAPADPGALLAAAARVELAAYRVK